MRAGRFQLKVLVGVWVAAIIIIFGGYELIERLWLGQDDMGLLHTLHILRGIVASAVTTLLIATYLVKRRPPTTILGGLLSYEPRLEADLVRHRAVWLIQMRWIVILLVASATVYACLLSDILPRENFVPLLMCLLVLFSANVFFAHQSSRTFNSYRLIIAQVVTDLVILTLLLHFSGGIENPFFLVYIFHVIIVGIVLLRREAILIAAFTCLLFAGLVGAELFELISHSYIGLFPHGDSHEIHAAHDLLFVFGRALPFLLVLGFTAYFTIVLREQIRQDQVSVIQASKLAAIGELTGRIAHEINNPIGIISTKTKLLLEREELSDKAISDLEKIDKHSSRIAELTQGLLTFCRPSLGNKSLLDLNRVVESSLSLIEAGQEGEGIEIKKFLHPSPPYMKGNVNELQQIILNIANNAIDAMPRGGQLTVKTGLESGALVLTISDTGIGIPTKIIDQIFDPFFTTKEEGKGTGLGLSITHGLVRSHGGIIEVESEEGAGTSFRIRFPYSITKKGAIHDEG